MTPTNFCFYSNSTLLVHHLPGDAGVPGAGSGAGCEPPGRLPYPRLPQPHPPLLPQSGEHGAHKEAPGSAGLQVSPRNQNVIYVLSTLTFLLVNILYIVYQYIVYRDIYLELE